MNEPKKYLDDEGLEFVVEKIKDKLDEKENLVTAITDEEIEDLFEDTEGE